MTVFAEQYDFVISLLLLDDSVPVFLSDEENEQDTFEKMVPAERRRDWWFGTRYHQELSRGTQLRDQPERPLL
jgi:hypothetical protein